MEENDENLEDQQIQAVYVCSVCEIIFERLEINNHRLLSRISTKDLSIVRRSEVNGSEEIITEQLASIGSSDNQLSQSLSVEEQLIHLIHEREPLWNLKNLLEKRSKENKEKLWEEVAAAIRSGYTMATLKKK